MNSESSQTPRPPRGHPLRGHSATERFPRKGWGEIAKRTKNEVTGDNVPLVAAGVAFYIFLGIIPALTAIISIYGLVMGTQQVQQHFQYLTSILPAQTGQLEQQVMSIASNQAIAGWGAALGLLVMLWSGSKATKALITATNIAYDRPESRGFMKVTLLSLGLTLAGVAFAVLAIALVAVLPAIVGLLGLGSTAESLINWLRWPLLIVCFFVALAVLYRYAPDRPFVRWRWVSVGAVAAALLWVAGSLLLSLYISQFGNYNKTYGSLGAVVILLLWLYLTAFAVVAGAELNSETEHYADQVGGGPGVAPSHPGEERQAEAA